MENRRDPECARKLAWKGFEWNHGKTVTACILRTGGGVLQPPCPLALRIFSGVELSVASRTLKFSQMYNILYWKRLAKEV